MRIPRLMIVVLMALGLMVITAGAVMAAPNGSTQAATGSGAAGLDLVTAPAVTPTLSFTHPVGLAISRYFGITYTQVMSLHQSGLGFGEISRLYMIAKYSDGKLTPDRILAMRESGAGWGQIMKTAGFKPGGKNLGSIMSGRGGQGKEPPNGKPDKADRSDCPGKNCQARDKDK